MFLWRNPFARGKGHGKLFRSEHFVVTMLLLQEDM